MEAEGPLCTSILVVKEASWTVAMPFERLDACLAIGGGGVSELSSPRVTVKTKVNPELFLEGRGARVGRGCHFRADLVDIIIRGRDASGAGWRGGVVKLAADLHEDVAVQKV